MALQGGGAHGAFTWGVLDRLLEEEGLALDTVSAASAGAVNAVAMLDGLADGGRETARAKLEAVWQAISKAGFPDVARLNPFLAGLARVPALVSPYTFNPLDINPLRSILAREIDFERLRARPPARLIISATDVATGKARLFRETEVTVDVVLASACLPSLYRAVEIEGRSYWDGGFSANPELISLILGSQAAETLLILLNPLEATEVPKRARDIADGVSRITFNQPVLRDLAEIESRRRAVGTGWRRWLAQPEERRLAAHALHTLSAAAHTSEMGPETKLQPGWELLSHLRSAGRAEAQSWLTGGTAAPTTNGLARWRTNENSRVA
ncbi:MAG: patatin-like phospholipase family protein [Hyphomicrobiaceae bacterium]